jgi:hypothetical protein
MSMDLSATCELAASADCTVPIVVRSDHALQPRCQADTSAKPL